MEDIKAIWSGYLGASASNKTLEVVTEASRMVRISRGDNLVEQSDEGSQIYLVVSGRLKAVRYSQNGHQIWLADIDSGGLAGEISALTNRHRTSSLVADYDTVLAALPEKVFMRLMASDSQFGTTIAKTLAKRIVETSDQLANLMAMSVTARLHEELIRNGTQDPTDSELFRQDVSVSSLSERIHATREATSRALSELVRRGLARRDGATVVAILPLNYR